MSGTAAGSRDQAHFGVRSDRVWTIVAFCLLVMFYFTTGVANRVESVDTLSFSADAEVAPFWSNPDARMILFYRLNRFAYRGLNSLGLEVGVYPILTFLGSLFAAGAVLLLYRLLSRAFMLSRPASIAGALTLAFSYGFLRYANEIEVYIGATFLILLCLNLLFDSLDRKPFGVGRAAFVGAVSGIAVAYYQPTAFPLFFAAALPFLYKRSLVQYVAYGAAGVGTFAAIAILALWTEHGHVPTIHEITRFLAARTDEFDPPPLSIASFAKAGAAVLHDIASLTPLYSIPGAEEFIKRAAPYHYYYAEEIFFAVRNYGLAWLGVCTFFATMAWLAYLAIAAVLAPGPRSIDYKIAFILAWLTFAGATNLLLNPGEREVWIVILPAIAILIAVLVYEPLGNRTWQLALMVGLLLSHNFIGGIGIFRNESGDLFASRTSWLRAHADQGDWVVSTGETSDWFNRMRMLRYPIAKKPDTPVAPQFFNFMYFDGDNAVVQRWHEGPYVWITPEQMLHTLKTEGNRIFALEATINPRPLPPRVDINEKNQKLITFGNLLRSYATLVDDTPMGRPTRSIRQGCLTPSLDADRRTGD